MIKGRISDWVNEINKISEISKDFYYKDNKIEDQKKLRKLDLPSFDSISFDVINIDSEKLNDFFKKYHGIFLRVIPNEEGLKKGFKKRYIFGYYGIDYFLDFIKKVKEENDFYEKVEFQEWDEDIYGWILISNGKNVIGEISKNLDNLAHHNELPLSSFVAEFPDHELRINWIIREEDSSIFLEKALRFIIEKNSNSFIKGYFEGVTTKHFKNIFFDYKENEIYFKL